MSNDNKFWAVIWLILGSTSIAIIFFMCNYWIDHNEKIRSMVESGIDPVAVMCAMQDDYGTHPTCLVLAARKSCSDEE